MALPKEPRQKMINVMYLVLTAILALNVSNEVITAFKVVDQSLRTSNEIIEEGNETVYKSLEAKLSDPQSAEKAKIWEPKANQAKKLSAEIYDYIEGLKLELKKGADLRINEDGSEDFREDYLDAATRLFDTQGKGEELKNKLDAYKAAMLAISPEIEKEFSKNFAVNTDTKNFKSREGKVKNFTQTYFYMTPTIAALTMLSKFQNNVRNAESEIVTFCHNQIGAVKVVYDQFAPLVGQSSNYLMPGDKITIRAGVGSFNKEARPVVTIGGQNVPVNPTTGLAEYTIPASGTGAHKVPVTVRYTKPDGTEESQTIPVDYTVGIPSGTAVSLDKMNVLYVGLDNPMTISSGTGWDKTKVSISSNATLHGSNGSYTVKVTGTGTATLTVNADGKITKKDFRIKQVPDPVFMVGPSEAGRIQSVVFKNQRFARAELKDFIYEYKYNIVSATVYFSGTNFPNIQTATIQGGSLAALEAQLAKCVPGTTVIFDNIKVQGPGGPVKSIPAAGFVLY